MSSEPSLPIPSGIGDLFVTTMFDIKDSPAGVSMRCFRFANAEGVAYGFVHNETRATIQSFDVLVKTNHWLRRFVVDFGELGLRDGHGLWFSFQTGEPDCLICRARVTRQRIQPIRGE